MEQKSNGRYKKENVTTKLNPETPNSRSKLKTLLEPKRPNRSTATRKQTSKTVKNKSGLKRIKHGSTENIQYTSQRSLTGPRNKIVSSIIDFFESKNHRAFELDKNSAANLVKITDRKRNVCEVKDNASVKQGEPKTLRSKSRQYSNDLLRETLSKTKSTSRDHQKINEHYRIETSKIQRAESDSKQTKKELVNVLNSAENHNHVIENRLDIGLLPGDINFQRTNSSSSDVTSKFDNIATERRTRTVEYDFGYSAFSSNETNNYYVEAYNALGQELLITEVVVDWKKYPNVEKEIIEPDIVSQQNQTPKMIKNKGLTSIDNDDTQVSATWPQENEPEVIPSVIDDNQDDDSWDLSIADCNIFSKINSEEYFLPHNDNDWGLQIADIVEGSSSYQFEKVDVAGAIKKYDIIVQVSDNQTAKIKNASKNLEISTSHDMMKSLESFDQNLLASERLAANASKSTENLVDEGISMLREDEDFEEKTAKLKRKQTILDANGNVRIQRIASQTDSVEPTDQQIDNRSMDNRGKLFYIIDELKFTEKKYIEDLNKIVNCYIPYIKENTTSQLLEKLPCVFSNIDELYAGANEFLVDLDACDEDANKVAETFMLHEELFKKYPVYLQNKPKADMFTREFSSVVKKCQDDLEDKLDLSAYLLTPLQRLGKYILMLENIQKELQKKHMDTNKVSRALSMMKKEMMKGNDAVAIESITHCPFSLTGSEPFIMRDKFLCLKPKRIEYMVFLFDKIVLFTTIPNKNMELFAYVDSIRMDHLTILSRENEPTLLELLDYNKVKKISNNYKTSFLLEAPSEKTKRKWSSAIEEKLWKQLIQTKENQLKSQDSIREKYKMTNPSRAQATACRRNNSNESDHRRSVFYT